MQNEHLDRLLARAAPLWAGEAEVVWSYFQSPGRNERSDIGWIRRQCYKELWGSGVGDREKGLFLGPVEELRAGWPELDRGVDRHELLAILEGLHAEFRHYCLFADLHDRLAGARLDPSTLTSWPADEELARLRYAYMDQHGELGQLAVRLSEGGRGTLYRTGMRLAGTGPVNDLIAAVCAAVYRDEIDHMRAGLAGLVSAGLDAGRWDEVIGWTETLLLQRIHMRNEQFGSPLSAERIGAITAGDIEPLPLDDLAPLTALGSTER